MVGMGNRCGYTLGQAEMGMFISFPSTTYLLVHELKVLRLGGQSGDFSLFTAIPVQRVVVIQANDSGHVANEGIAIGVSTSGRLGSTTEDASDATHKS